MSRSARRFSYLCVHQQGFSVAGVSKKYNIPPPPQKKKKEKLFLLSLQPHRTISSHYDNIMSLLECPNEVLIIIAEALIPSPYNINALTRTCHRCYQLFNSILYTCDAEHHNGSALSWAATRGMKTTAEKSIQSGATLSKKSNYTHPNMLGYMMGETDDENFLDPKKTEQPISRAARAGHLEIVALLLKHGVDPNYCNAAGGSPLILAIQRGHLDLVLFLLSNGADPLLECAWGQFPVLHSVYKGRAEILKVLLDHLEQNHPAEAKDQMQQALAAAAGRNDRIEIIPILLTRDADINCQASRLLPLDLLPLCRAVNSRNLDMVKFLLENGADPNIIDSDGEGPLSEVCGTNNIQLLRFLVDYGVDMSR